MLSLSKSKWFVVSLVVIVLFQMGDCLQCYQGNLTITKEIACDKSCRKFVMSGGAEDITEYSCSADEKPTNCSTIVEDKITTIDCYCNEDLCNSSPMAAMALPFLLGSLFMKVIL